MSQARVSPDKARALVQSSGGCSEHKRIRIHRICLFGFDENRGNSLLAASRASKKCSSIASHTDAELAEICLPDGGHVREQDAISIVLASSSGTPFFGYAYFRNIQCAAEKRGARQASLLLISDYPGMDVFRPFLMDALNILMEGSTWGNVEHYTKSLTCLRGAIERGFNRSASQRLIPIEANEETVTLELWQRAYKIRRVPFGVAEFGDSSLKDLVAIFKEKTIRIWYALASEKRVIFVGQHLNASSLSSLVLAAPALVGELAEFVVPNLEPYLTLGVIERIVNKRSFVCGTNNALFLSKPEWWDVCCDVTTGAVIEQDEGVGEPVQSQPSQQHLPSVSRTTSRVLSGLRRRVSSQAHHQRNSSFPQSVSLPSASRVTSGGAEMAFISRLLHDFNPQSEAWIRRQFHDFTLSFLNRVARRGTHVDLATALVGLLPTSSLMQPRLTKFAEHFGQGALWKKYRAKQDTVWGGSAANALNTSGTLLTSGLPSPAGGSFSEQAWAEETQFLGSTGLRSLSPYLMESARGDSRSPTGFIRVEDLSKRSSWARTRGTSENDQPVQNKSFREHSSLSPKRPLAAAPPFQESPERWVRVKPKTGEVYFWNVETGETTWDDPDLVLL